MTTAPFDVRPVVDRLRAAVPALRLVGLAADYATVKSLRDFTAPSAYVLLAQEAFEPTPTGHGERGQQRALNQRVEVHFGVVIAARNYREQAGAQMADDIQTLIGQTRTALMGWVPDAPGARPLQLAQGELLQYDDAIALWSDVWRTHTVLGSEAA